MRTLIFLRHGKSDWDVEYGGDHERPLAERGRKAARRMGRLLRKLDLAPDSAVSSSAVRARTTLELAREAGDWTCPTRLTRALYHATPTEVIREVQGEEDSTQVLLLVGHEPTWSETVSLLTGGARLRFPTAAMARVDLVQDSWKDTRPGGGQLVWLIPPKLLKAWSTD